MKVFTVTVSAESGGLMFHVTVDNMRELFERLRTSEVIPLDAYRITITDTTPYALNEQGPASPGR